MLEFFSNRNTVTIATQKKKKFAESIVSLIQLNIEKYTIALVATIMCKHAPLTAWKRKNAPLLSHILYLFQYQLQLQVSFSTT